MNWEDQPDYGALWLQYCTRVGYVEFVPWMKRNHPAIEVGGEMQSRAAELHEALLAMGMEAIEREAREKP